MKLIRFRTFLILFVTLIFIAQFTVWNVHENKRFYSMKVKVMPIPEEMLTDEEFYWRSQKFLFPQIETPNPIPQGLPYDHSLLLVALEKDGSIKLNSETTGNLENLEAFKQRLKEIFQERTERGVFEPNSDKIIKAIAIKSPLSAKYGDVAKIVDALKECGADPIVLQIDSLSQ
jgi:biopolymer transport protein ExbD